jgi:hypothetical protein
VAALEKLQRYFVNPSLAPIEFEFFPAFRNRTACAHLWFVCARFRLRCNDNPRSALGACDARAHNAMGHMEIIWAAGSAFAVCEHACSSKTDGQEELRCAFST